jgi:hypothetical protein
VYTPDVNSLMAWARWRWRQLAGRNRLVRPGDRVEAAAVLAVLLVALGGGSVAGAVGTGVYDSRAAVYAAQDQQRRPATGTVVGSDPLRPRSPGRLVHLRWQAGQSARTGTLVSGGPVTPGQQLPIWVDRSGDRLAPPPRPWQPGLEAVAAAIALWAAITATAAALFGLVRVIGRRSRFREWDRDLSRLRTRTS